MFARLCFAPVSAHGARRLISGTSGSAADTAIRDVLGEAIAAGGSSLRDFVDSDGKLGYFQHGFAVYDRAGAPCTTDGCNAKIKRIVQSGRSSFYCPACQR